MSPKISSAAPKSAPPAPIESQPMQVGKLVVAADAAKATSAALRIELARTKDPKAKAALQTRLDSATVAEKAATRALDDAFTQLPVAKGAKKSDPKAKAAAIFELREKLEAELQTKRAELSHVPPKKLEAAKATIAALEAGIVVADKHLAAAEDSAIQKTRGGRDGFDNRTDAASMTVDQQRKKLGAPVVGISADAAFKYDVEQMQAAAKLSPRYAAAKLASQLKTATPEQQLKLLRAFGPELEQMASSMTTGAEQSMLSMLETVKGPAKQELAALIVKHPGGMSTGVMPALKELIARGEGFEAAGALIAAMPASHAKMELVQMVDRGIVALRTSYTEAKEKSDEALTEFSRATFGFAQSFPSEQVEAYRDAFLAKNKAKFEATEAAAAKYLNVATAAATGAFDSLGTKNTYFDEDGLRHELKEAGKNLPALLDSDAGKQLLQSSLEAQQEKIPNFLDQLAAKADKAGALISIAQGTSDVLARGMVKFAALRGTDPKVISSMIEKNAHALGIPESVKSKYASAIAKANDPSLTAVERLKLQKAAANTIEGGKQGGTAAAALGILLTGPSLVNGWYNFKDAKMMEQVQTLIGSVNAGKDLVSLVSDAAVLGKIAKVTGGIGIALSVIQGVGELSNGKWVDGGTSLAAGLGGALMLVPGGQLFGAAILVGSALTKHLWGSDPAAEAEDKAEDSVKDFLVAMKMRPEIAAELKDVLQDGLRGVGAALPQLAEWLNTTPAELMKHLNELSPEKVRAFVKMVKEMPSDDKWQFREREGAADSRRVDSREIGRPEDHHDDPRYYGPISIPSAAEWMRKYGYAPTTRVQHGSFGNQPHAVSGS